MPLVTGTANPDILSGTIDADTLLGLGADDVLYAFDGSDLLQGGQGDDILHGGSGDDTLDGGAGEDLFYGQSGRDTVTYATALAALTVNLTEAALSTGDAAGDVFLSIENFILSTFNDSFVGSAFRDQAQGGLGDDTMRGLAGDDSLLGEAGNDVLEGGIGADTLVGGAGSDTASYAQAGTAVRIDLTASPATFTGDAFGDVLTSIEALRGSGFNDRFVLAGGVISALGGEGNDTLIGALAAETLAGEAGDDSLVGGGGVDSLSGGAGNDRLFGGLGADVLNGGANTDTAIYSTKVTLNLLNTANGAGEAKGDVLVDVETLVFGAKGSVYVGGAQSLSVVLTGQAMTCLAGSGAESFSVDGLGALAVSYLDTTSAVTLTYLGGGIPDGGTVLQGTGGANGDLLRDVSSLTLTNLADTLTMEIGIGLYVTGVPLTLKAGLGNDNLGLAIAGATLIDGGGGNDTITGILVQGTVTGGLGRDVITLSDTGTVRGSVTLSGGDGNDQISASGYGSAEATGDAGNDTITVTGEITTVDITGGLGDDTISAGFISMSGRGISGDAGNDTITVTGETTTADINGGIGDDTISAELVSLISGEVSGDAGNDVIEAMAASGTVLGGDGNDDLSYTIVVTGAGTSTADGGAGNDTITMDSVFPGSTLAGNQAVFIGGAGDDSLTDTTDDGFVFSSFRFASGWGNDTITGFSDGIDVLIFDTIAGLTQFSDLTVSARLGGGVSISFGSDTIQLLGVDLPDIGADDMQFI